eukprot:CAMPEP_0184867304 /NCGR_PEP_ID=MMETSP0580-20130426/25917_1 /TAXON_ID=1118495 /ORGANISM="Dactyliosolen fragilissimus" /LENGTH=476 /DNA_ID=CAMNT_0027367499 /DNA_START=127 /DNA_END=1557 /DNA_ORIENTATION=-
MNHTPKAIAPVITLLSSSPKSSRKTQRIFEQLFQLKPIKEGGKECLNNNDALDSIFHPLLRKRWDSAASICVSSGTVLHFLSLTLDKKRPNKNDDDSDLLQDGSLDTSFSLLSISSAPSLHHGNAGNTKIMDAQTSIQETRRLLAEYVRMSNGSNWMGMALFNMKINMSTMLNRPTHVLNSQILGRDDGLPFLKLPLEYSKDDLCLSFANENNFTSPGFENDCKQKRIENTMRFREIVLPHFDDATYPNGSSLLSELSNSNLAKPLPGLYQWPSIFHHSSHYNSKQKNNKVQNQNIALRPLPSSNEDIRLPPPTLIFQCPSLDDARESLTQYGVQASKIGFSGNKNSGQLRVIHEAFSGLDVRFCEQQNLSAQFAESQEALMSASLEELQSTNIFLEGGAVKPGKENDKATSLGNRQSKGDSMNGMGDCWVEFRANIRQPAGFFKNRKNLVNGKSFQTDKFSKVERVAKPPDIPYE